MAKIHSSDETDIIPSKDSKKEEPLVTFLKANHPKRKRGTSKSRISSKVVPEEVSHTEVRSKQGSEQIKNSGVGSSVSRPKKKVKVTAHKMSYPEDSISPNSDEEAPIADKKG